MLLCSELADARPKALEDGMSGSLLGRSRHATMLADGIGDALRPIGLNVVRYRDGQHHAWPVWASNPFSWSPDNSYSRPGLCDKAPRVRPVLGEDAIMARRS